MIFFFLNELSDYDFRKTCLNRQNTLDMGPFEGNIRHECLVRFLDHGAFISRVAEEIIEM